MINIIEIGETRKNHNSDKATAVEMFEKHTPPLFSLIRSCVCALNTFSLVVEFGGLNLLLVEEGNTKIYFDYGK